MRALQYIIVTFIVLSVLLASGFLVLREASLYRAKGTLSKSMAQLRKARSSGNYHQECIRKGAITESENSVVTLQLRFISSKDYILEAVCDQFSFDPITIGKGELPDFVTKKPGSSGFVMDAEVPSAISVGVLEDFLNDVSETISFDLDFLVGTRKYAYQDRSLVEVDDSQYYAEGPVTNCSGYGYTCCDSITQVGIGDRIIGLNDCSDTCYLQCSARPVLLSFTTNPFINTATRTVSIRSGDQVDFSFLADGNGDKNVRAVILFGDGARSEVPSAQGTTTHTYSCDQDVCTYPVEIMLYDSWEVESSKTSLSQLVVEVKR